MISAPVRVLAACVIGVPLLAQEQRPDTARIEPVIVTATRDPIARGALPVAVTVITGDELRLRGITSVGDALTSVTSAYVAQAGSQGATTSLFLRGGESRYVKVLIDGVPVNDPGGTFDFASLTTDNVERIEVVRGPASVIYGADAATGVVNVITRRGTGAPLVEARASVGAMVRDPAALANAPGSDSAMVLQDLSAALRGGLDAMSYSMELAQHKSEGLYPLNNHYQNNVLSGRVEFSPDAATQVRLSLRYHDYQYNYPTSPGGEAAPGDHNAFRSEDRMAVGAEIERRLAFATLVLALNTSVNDGSTDDQPDTVGGAVFVSQDKMRRRGAELRARVLPFSIASVTAGVQIEQQDQRSQLQSDGEFGPFNDRFSAARQNRAGYAEIVLSPNQTITATMGARLDDNQQFGTFRTGRLGISWRALPHTRLRATAGTAFREPTFAENFSAGFSTGNPDLQPERTRSVDFGIEHQALAGRIRAAVTGFAQRFANIIDYTGSTAACGYSYCNVAAATSNGIEIETEARVLGGLRAAAGATFLATRVTTPGFDNTSGGLYKQGEALIRRPARSWNVELAYRGAQPLSAAIVVRGVGERTDRDFRVFPSTPVTLPAYRRIDLGAQYDLRSHLFAPAAVTLRVENAANVHYENVFNFLAPRRTISLGVRLGS